MKLNHLVTNYSPIISFFPEYRCSCAIMATQTAEGGSATVCETEAGSQVDNREENSTTLKLKLQKKDKTRKKIQWTEDTIDNEGEAGF